MHKKETNIVFVDRDDVKWYIFVEANGQCVAKKKSIDSRMMEWNSLYRQTIMAKERIEYEQRSMKTTTIATAAAATTKTPISVNMVKRAPLSAKYQYSLYKIQAKGLKFNA